MSYFVRNIELYMSKEHKERDAFNENNRSWHKLLSVKLNKESLETMKYIGCSSRGAFLNQAIVLMNRINGKKNES